VEASDYEGAGMAYDAPSVRSRLQEGLAVMKGSFRTSPWRSRASTTTCTNGSETGAAATPAILIGGGDAQYAAREADIVGVNFLLAEGVVNREDDERPPPPRIG
jgi:hypothetical protein